MVSIFVRPMLARMFGWPRTNCSLILISHAYLPQTTATPTFRSPGPVPIRKRYVWDLAIKPTLTIRYEARSETAGTKRFMSAKREHHAQPSNTRGVDR